MSPLISRLVPAAAVNTLAAEDSVKPPERASVPSVTASPPAAAGPVIENDPGPTFSITPAPEIVPLKMLPSGWLKRTVAPLLIEPKNEPVLPSPIARVPSETRLVPDRKLVPVRVRVLEPDLAKGWLPIRISSGSA